MGVGADWREYVCIVLYSQQKGEEANVNISYLYSTQEAKTWEIETQEGKNDKKKQRNKEEKLGLKKLVMEA